jgi:hypothetical protein
MRLKPYSFLFFVFLFISNLLHSQVTENSWQIISSHNFDLYLPKSSDLDYGRLLQDAEHHLENCERLIDFHLNESIRLVLSKNPNIVKVPLSFNNSKSTEVELDRHTGYIVSNDDYSGILLQVKYTITNILLNDLLYGKSLQERIQNKTLLQIPDWFTQGFAAYFNENWLNGYDGALREIFLQHPDAGFNFLLEQNEKLAGFSFWKFISDQYGKDNVANFLYNTKLSRSLENGFYFVFGKGMPDLFKEWQTYYSVIYKDEFGQQAATQPTVKGSAGLVSIALSPNGRWLAGLSYTRFTPRVVVVNIRTGQRSIINESHGVENITLRWDESNSLLYNTSQNNSIKIAFYNPSRNIHTRYLKVKDFDKILNFTCDGQHNFIFYGVNRSKLYLVQYSAQDKNITVLAKEQEVDDISMVQGTSFIFFRYDSVASLIKAGEKRDSLFTVRSISDIHILDIDSTGILFSNNGNGLVQAYKYYFSNHTIRVVTSFNRFAFGISGNGGTVLHTIGYPDNFRTLSYTLNENDTLDEIHPYFYKYANGAVQKEEEVSVQPEDTSDIKAGNEPTKPAYYFLNGFDPDDEKEDQARLDSLRREEQKNLISLSYLKSYELTFSTLKVSMLQLDNSNYFNMLPLMPMDPLTPQYFYYYNYIKSEIALKDILNKYQLFGGIRISTHVGGGFDSYFKAEKQFRRYVLSASTYFFQKKFILENENDILKQQVAHTDFSYKLKINETSSIKAEVYGMQEWRTLLSLEHSNLILPGSSNFYTGTIATYEFSRMKRYADFIYDGLLVDVAPNIFYNTATRHINSDFSLSVKYYQPVYRRITWSNFLNINASAGKEKVLNILGGADYWIFGKYDLNNQFSNQQTYILRNYAGAIRGFRQNARNGNNSFCINSELRIPLSSLVSKWPTDRDWYRNLLLIPFVDLGSAWDGFNLFSEKNNYTTRIFDYTASANQNVAVSVKNLRQPVIASFGVGINTRILGYNLRFDIASGIEDGLVKKPLYLLSYGTSF